VLLDQAVVVAVVGLPLISTMLLRVLVLSFLNPYLVLQCLVSTRNPKVISLRTSILLLSKKRKNMKTLGEEKPSKKKRRKKNHQVSLEAAYSMTWVLSVAPGE
jgi:hypothetical protein